MIKVESGTGHLNSNLLAYTRNLVFVIYPGVPNNTTVTQETDQNYGPFKTQFKENLNTLSDARIINNYYTTLQSWMVGIIVFGGIYSGSKVELNTSAFEKVFSR